MQELEQAHMVKSHYNEISGQWGTFYDPEVTFANYNFLIRKRHVLELFNKQGGRFLDAGCGTGDFIPDLVERDGEVFAVDFAEEMVERAKQKAEANGSGGIVHCSVADVCKMNFDANFFDAIIGVGLVEYLADLDGALREMYRVLKPGGIAIITMPNIASPFMAYETLVPKLKGAVKRVLAAVGLRAPERSYFQRHVIPWSFDRQLRRAGFRKTGYAFCTYGFFSARGKSVEALSLSLSRSLDRFGQSPIGILGTNYIVRVEKPRR